MTDIVERLRSLNADFLHEEAAAEIERLRAERHEAVATLDQYRAENGCTRGQRTTQWCAEATSLRVEVANLQRLLLKAEMEAEIAALGENNHD